MMHFKTLITTLGLSCFAICLYGQTDTVTSSSSDESSIQIKGDINMKTDTPEGQPDTNRFHIKELEFWVINRSDTTEEVEKDEEDFEESDHWGGLWIGVNGYLTPDQRLQVREEYQYLNLSYPRSLNFKLNFEVDIPLYQQYVKFITGLGFDFTSYGLKHDYTLQNSKDSIWARKNPNIDFTKNNLNITYLNLPLMLAFNSHREADQSFHFSAGVLGGYRIFSAVKQKFKTEEDRSKRKVKGDFHLNPFRYGLISQVGYGEFNLYATYDLSGLFNPGGGPRLHPFTVGLRIVGF